MQLHRLVIMCAFVLTALVAEDDLQITSVDVDQTVYVPPYGPSLTLSSTTRSLRFHLKGPVEAGQRLRYRLDGVDPVWRDPPNRMRILVNFENAKKEVVGSRDFDLVGETEGWQDDVERSVFHPRREMITIPAQATNATLSILSHGEDLGVGVLGVDNLRVFITAPDSAQATTVELDTTSGRDMETVLGSPTFWFRGFGNRAEIAEVRIRSQPMPHPILVLNDSDPQRYGNWALAKRPIPVREGGTFTLAWDTAHSIGRSGVHIAAYDGLKPGTYVFRTMLTESNGSPTGRQIYLQLVVEEPLHQRWYFWLVTLVLAVIAGTALGFLFRRRVLTRRLEDLQRRQSLVRERERIARDLHDNIGAGLTEIAMLGDLVHSELGELKTTEMGTRVARIRQSATELARSVDEIVWAINPTHDNLTHFVNYLTQCSSQFLESANLPVRYVIPSDLPTLPISGKVRHNLFLVVREALNNIVKYAQPSVVHLKITLTEGVLTIVVEDDGVGFDLDHPAPEGTHNGIDNMRRRTQDVSGTIRFITSPGRGTRIEVEAPLPSAPLQPRGT
jgi:signal transduction histidine kinase